MSNSSTYLRKRYVTCHHIRQVLVLLTVIYMLLATRAQDFTYWKGLYKLYTRMNILNMWDLYRLSQSYGRCFLCLELATVTKPDKPLRSTNHRQLGGRYGQITGYWTNERSKKRRILLSTRNLRFILIFPCQMRSRFRHAILTCRDFMWLSFFNKAGLHFSGFNSRNQQVGI